MSVNRIKLTEDLNRNGKTYPKGTVADLVGLLPNVLSSPVSIGIRVGNELVEVTSDIKKCTDFKYELVREP